MRTFFAAQENQYPGTQLQYIFFHCATFYLIPPSSVGDLARNSQVPLLKKIVIFDQVLQAHFSLLDKTYNPGAQLQYIFFHCATFYLISPSSVGDLARNS